MEVSCSRIQKIEHGLVALGISVFKSVFCFLSPPYQSLMVSFVHYAIFFAGLYYFIYRSKPHGLYRPLFFTFVLISLVCYIVFNKCLLTHMELGISKEQNAIQATVESFFGSQTEGNVGSKVVLSLLTVVTGLFLINDYGILKVSD